MPTPVELSVSNICWPAHQAAHEEAIETLVRLDVPAIDVNPVRVWPQISRQGLAGLSRGDIKDFNRTLCGRKIAALQSLDYTAKGETFGSKEGRRRLSEYTHDLIELAALLGARAVTYSSGSLSGRNKSAEATDTDLQHAQDFFHPLAAHAYDRGVILGIEPNLANSGADVVRFIKDFDTHSTPSSLAFAPSTFAMHNSGEDTWDTICDAADNGVLAPHWRITEIGMGQIGNTTDVDHTEFATCLEDIASSNNRFLRLGRQGTFKNYDGPITLTVEMYPFKELSAASSLARAVNFVRATYPVV